MQILPGAEMVGLTLYLEKLNSLVIGDVHIGYEEGLNRRGVLIPRYHFQDVVAGLGRVFQELQPLLKKAGHEKLDKIIVNGDLKHEFGVISGQEWREILKFLDLLSQHCKAIVLVKGNHDVILGPIARKRKLELVDDYSVDGVFICHGHKIPGKNEYKNARLLIIGNEHPAVSIKDGPRTEPFKCFLKGTFDGKAMVVMPSFNPITIGTDILRERFISPFMKTDISDFEVFVAADKAYYFGKVRGLM